MSEANLRSSEQLIILAEEEKPILWNQQRLITPIRGLM